jgi:hypothetical protein
MIRYKSREIVDISATKEWYINKKVCLIGENPIVAM